ncbi:hypothetical protein [Natronorubrum sp. DTA7]|uniref:hypothetical protein n=1 Tax=Natronorubrum sp. DTA7 TaxID=3447016 RepID=UPI003F864DA4
MLDGSLSPQEMIYRQSKVLGIGVLITIISTLVFTLILGRMLNLGIAFTLSFGISLVGTSMTVFSIFRDEKNSPSSVNQTNTINMIDNFELQQKMTKKVVERPDGGRDWTSMSKKELVEVIESSPNWRSYPDESFNSSRDMAQTLHYIGNWVSSLPYMDREKITISLYMIAAIGGTMAFLTFVEVIDSTWTGDLWMTSILNISPFSLDPISGMLMMVVSLFIFASPFIYLQTKKSTTCPECNEIFTISSRGRFFRPAKDVRQTEQGEVYHGLRILDCVSCEHIVIQETDWEEE